jgi:hypothetical protein
MSKTSLLLAGGIAAAVCFLSCERVPQNAISDASSALERAEKAGARAWAPSQLKRGHALFDSAMKELALEKKKMPFNRNYKDVIHLLDIAAEAGDFAIESHQKTEDAANSEAQPGSTNAFAPATR